MSYDYELTRRLLKDLVYLYESVEKAEDKIENLRDDTDDLAKSLKAILDRADYDYTEALDSVLNITRGTAYKSLVGVFGLTPDEAERAQQQLEAAQAHRQNEAKKWADYLQECEDKRSVATHRQQADCANTGRLGGIMMDFVNIIYLALAAGVFMLALHHMFEDENE